MTIIKAEGVHVGLLAHTTQSRKNISSLFASMTTICVIWLVNTWFIGFFSGTTQRSTLSFPSSALASPRLSSVFFPTDFSLGREQSGGFFTDITNENWKMLQKYHAELFPNYYIESSFTKQEENLNKYSHTNDPGWGENRLSLLRNSNMWYGRNFQVEFICPMARRLPSDSISDGAKWVSRWKQTGLHVGRGESNMILCRFYLILTSTPISSFACVHTLVYISGL